MFRKIRMMMGSFLSRALLMVFGYAYPAYQCFKAVEKENKPETQHLLFWCRYWILVAMFSVGERVGDTFISWLPMYSEAKLAFLIYLWYPKTKGTAYVYNSWVQPYIEKHETEIDHKLLEMNIKASEIGVLIWQKAEGYGQTRFLEILQYFSSQPRAHSDQLLLDSAGDSTNQKQSEHFLPDSFSEEAGHLLTSIKNVTTNQSDTDTSLETMPVEAVSSPGSRNQKSSEKETVSKRLIRQTRGKWRIFRV